MCSCDPLMSLNLVTWKCLIDFPGDSSKSLTRVSLIKQCDKLVTEAVKFVFSAGVSKKTLAKSDRHLGKLGTIRLKNLIYG
jgi:hypothetical protein